METKNRYIAKISRVAGMYTSMMLKDGAYNNTEIMALHYIRHNKGINQNTLKEKLAVDKSAVARIVAKFEADGLVEKRKDENDKRINLLYPTEKAQKLKLNTVSFEDKFYNWLVDGIDKTELDTFYNVLEKLYLKSKNERRSNFKNIMEYEKN